MKNKNTLSQYVLSVEDVDFDRQLKSRRFVRTGACAGLAIMLLYVVACILPPVGNDDTNAATKPAVASDTVLSINIDDPAISLELTPTSASGTFATTSTPINVGVATNNITGYTVGIKASSSSDTATKLINSITECEDTPTSAKCSINTLDDAVSAADYAAVAATELNNTWGYLPSKYNSVVNEDYLPAPSNGGDIIEATSAPNAPQPGYSGDTTDVSQLTYNEYTIDLGARLDYTPYAGSYTNTFVITAVGNPVPYSVTYLENKPMGLSDDMVVENVPGAQADSVNSGSTMALLLSTNVPMISDTTGGASPYAPYVFAGWCTVQPEVPDIFDGVPNTGNYQVCPDDATLYQPGDNYGIDQTQAINTDTLYATWQAPVVVTFDGDGLVFNATADDTKNAVEYIPVYAGGQITGAKTNYKYAGAYAEPAPLDATEPYVFKGWSTESGATTPMYVTESDIENNLDLDTYHDITLYAVWNYATEITFDANAPAAEITGTMSNQLIDANSATPLNANGYARTGYYFAGWDVDASAYSPTYSDGVDYTASSQPATITLHAIWTDCAPNRICYDDNGVNSPITMDNQTVSSNTNVLLWAYNYKYDTNGDGYNDYGFVGWSQDKNAASAITNTGLNSGTIIYGPNQTMGVGDVSTAGIKLYAIWVEPVKDGTDNVLSFQTANLLTTQLEDGGTLASKSNGYVTALKDGRDNQVYAVAKLADGNYWMIENLRLDNNVASPNWGDNALSQGFGKDFEGLAEPELENFTNTTTSNSLYDTGDARTMPRYNNDNTASPVETMTRYTYLDNVYSLGNYYSWAAAIADTTAYTDSHQHTDVHTSICPAGWHLPYGSNGNTGTNLGNTSGGFYYLADKIGATAMERESSVRLRTFPNNFVYSGRVSDGMLDNRSYVMYYWTTSNYDNNRGYILTFTATSGFAGIGGGVKYAGHSVRCVAGA